MKKVLVTGAKGMLGQDLCPILKQKGYKVIETDTDNLNIINFNQAEYVIKYYNPDYVIHCAAYNDADKAEYDANTAFLINAKGTENIAKICADKEIELIYISTDCVFDGESSEPYLITDIRNPIGVYGKSKAEGEIAVEKYCKKYYIARTGWLYGHKGKNFIEKIVDLAQKMPEIKIANDQIGCPTWTVDLSYAISSLIEEEKSYGIYHFCSSGQVSRYEFACEALKLLNIKTKIFPCWTEEFPKRRENFVMDNSEALRDWRESLKNYIEMRG